MTARRALNSMEMDRLPTFLAQMRRIRDAAASARSADAPAGSGPVRERPLAGLVAGAREPALRDEGRVFTPTLVKRHPAPRTWILGDLSRPETVSSLLASFRAEA